VEELVMKEKYRLGTRVVSKAEFEREARASGYTFPAPPKPARQEFRGFAHLADLLPTVVAPREPVKPPPAARQSERCVALVQAIAAWDEFGLSDDDLRLRRRARQALGLK
jgi:hypothetical protein